jgi:hypothetical protein
MVKESRMIWHPLLIAVAVGDLLSLLLWMAAAVTAFRIVIKWDPHSDGRAQILLERRAETARLTARFSLAVFFISTALLIIGLTNVLPEMVPGAMCGTGVLQATNGFGNQTLIYRFLVFFILMVWSTYDKLNLSQPEAPLTRYHCRILLLALPFFFLAVITTFRGILRIDSHKPVSCCALVYNQFDNIAAARQIAGLPNAFWTWAFWILTALILLCAVWSQKTKRPNGETATATLAVLSVIWVMVAITTLVRVYATYFYQVLHHHCPWCLFLPEHKFVGIPLLAALVIVIMEGPISYLAAKIGANFPELLPSANRRSRLAGLRLLIAAAAFSGMVALPAIYWRLLYGVWIG